MSFDAERWRAERGNFTGENEREAMVSQLVRELLKPGTARAEVERLLGAPDGRSERADTYALGRSPAGPSYETLVIEYDAAGRVSGHRIERS